jgi:hypothetical protein
MKYDNLKDALNTFGDAVVSDAKKNLNASGKIDTGQLQNSLKNSGVIFHKNSLTLNIRMSNYGAFIEKGVRGVGSVRKTTSTFKRTNNKGKLWKQKGGNSPFSYKEGVKPSVKHFVEWSKKRGLNPYAVREAVYHQGIEPTPFLEDAIKKNITLMPTKIAEAFGLDVTSTLRLIIKSNFKK